MATDTDWCKDWDNVISLANWLEEGGVFDGPKDAIYFFEKPWKWSDEYQGMKSGVTYDEWQEAKEIAEGDTDHDDEDRIAYQQELCERVRPSNY